MTTEEYINSPLFLLLAEIGVRFMDSYQTDLLIDAPTIVKALSKNEDVILLVGHSHCDTIERYRACLKEKGNNVPTNQECFDYCQQTLGCDFVVIIHPNLSIGVQKINNTSFRCKWKLDNFKNSIPNGIQLEFVDTFKF